MRFVRLQILSSRKSAHSCMQLFNSILNTYTYTHKHSEYTHTCMQLCWLIFIVLNYLVHLNRLTALQFTFTLSDRQKSLHLLTHTHMHAPIMPHIYKLLISHFLLFSLLLSLPRIPSVEFPFRFIVIALFV